VNGILKSKSSRRAVLIILIALAAAVGYLVKARFDMTDFGVCYQAGGRIFRGETLYRPSDGHLQYKYAPVAAFLYTPFTILPWSAAKLLWYLLMFVFLAWTLKIIIGLLPGQGPPTAFVVVWSLAISSKFIGREFELGQVNLLILLLIVLMLRELTFGRDRPAGFFWAASLFFKPYAAVFLPYLIVKKKWTAVATGAGTLVLGLLLPVLKYGWTGNLDVLREWGKTLSQSTPGLLSVGDNASLYAFFAKNLGVSVPSALFLGGLGAAVCAAAILWMIVRGAREKIDRAEVLESTFLMILIPMLSPLGWNYNYLYALPAVVLLLHILSRFGSLTRTILIIDFVLIGATLRETLGKTVFRYYTSRAWIVPSFVLLLGFLVYARRRRLI